MSYIMKTQYIAGIVLTTILLDCAFCLEADQDHVGIIDPYTEILHLHNLTLPVEFLSTVLREFITDFARKIRCSESSQGATTDKCPYSFCVDTGDLLRSLGQENTSYIAKETFENVAVILLEIASDFEGKCHTVINITEHNVTSYPDRLLQRYRSEDVSGTLDILHIQESLETLDLEAHSHEHDYGHVEEPDSENHEVSLLHRERCLGADVLYDQMGYDTESSPSSHSLGHLAALVVYHIVTGTSVSRDCRILPRDRFFLEEIYHSYGDINDSMSHKAFGALLSALQIGGSQEVMHIEDDGHSHRRRREADDHDDFLHKESWATICYGEEELLAIFGIGEEGIPSAKFAEVCPAFLQQQLSRACANTIEDEKPSNMPSVAERYGYSTIAVILVCLCSVVGIFFVKCMKGAAYDVIMAIFLGLATGTLYTDAFLHLLPAALGAHEHEEEEEHAHEESDTIVVEPYVWFSLAACAGVYGFYLFEKVLKMMRRQRGHSDTEQQEDILPDRMMKHGHSESEHQEDMFPNRSMKSNGSKYEVKQTETQPEKKSKMLPSIAIMVNAADAIHNFADGLAMGASFTSSLYLGISTSIAVFCHELPHELGDFAIMIASGMSFTKALVCNFLVSLTAVVGLYVGLAVSENDEARKWIVAVTAGIFLYISLVDMMPQLLKESKAGVRDFVLHNVGILLGAAIMLIIAIFEEKIRV